MTREEAIKWIKYEKDSIDTEGYCATKENYARIQALDMAIEVLSVKDCHGCTHYDLLQTPVICHDCSRSYKDRYKDEKGTLDDMFTESAEAYKAWTGEEMGGSRLIDADALHEELMWAWKEATCEEERKTLRWVIDLVDIDSPTVSADRPHGEWIECLAYNPDLDVDVPYIECDQCRHRPYFSGSYRPKYCEECGAKMDGNTDNPHGFTADEWYRNTFKDGEAE